MRQPDGEMFARGITSPEFMDGLTELAGQPSWWRDVLDDPGLIIAIRREYLNVYWKGQSLFKIGHAGNRRVTAQTHPKYLLDPDLKNLVSFDGRRWSPAALERMIIHEFEPGKTLAKLKRAAERFAPREKQGVQEIVGRGRNPHALDVEIAVPQEASQIDIAALEANGDSVRLVFWEAKLFENRGSLRAAGEGTPEVLDQIARYRRVLDVHRASILCSYRQVAANLVQIATMRGGKRAADPLVQKIADQPECLVMAPCPEVGLLVFSFDDDQRRGEAWRPHRQKLEQALPGRFLDRGEAGNIRLPRG
ncbi:hypothetical protein [Teichococcus oryzae]|uniref:Uncharacterized protein n=1 Tax=Teichococcus oryzae TaxID=1608942 RepID=A0A5B2T9U3_9PROT|nr:hypothetical protein [Pseudoroseomonas oryzae]KAA2211361.1 hypothetical protein F0Q34_20470 [Pseudoroseomonas oryzae]